MLTYENLVGDQEDWANYITNVEVRETPLIEWLEVDKNPVKNVKYQYQAEKWRAPRDNAHTDGSPWTSFQSVGEGRGELQALVQWFDGTGSISKLSEDVSDIAGIADQLAREIPKVMKEMRQDMEAAFGDDTECQVGVSRVSPYKTRAMGKWIQSTAQATLPVPTDFLTPAGSIKSTSSTTVVENDFRDILQSMQQQTKQQTTIDGFVGDGTKRKFSDFQLFIPSSVSTQASGTVFDQSGTGKAVTRAVDVYNSDFGTLRLHLTYWLANLTGSATVQSFRGYFLHRNMWKARWKQKPQVYRPEFRGGSFEFAMDAILMLVCLNPKGEGKYAPTA
jgi:hypothetical protein